MKKLVIIGAGGFGREVLIWAQQSDAYRREWEIEGFLDDRPDALAPHAGIDLPILGNTQSYQPGSEQVFIIAVGTPASRAKLWNQFSDRGATFTRIVHRSCIVGRQVDLQQGVILCPGVKLTCDITIGQNTALNINTAVGHDATIGRDCQLSSFCDITGNVHVGNQVFMGSRASVIPNVKIGHSSVVGAGSVVISDVPDNVTVFGNPARILTRHE